MKAPLALESGSERVEGPFGRTPGRDRPEGTLPAVPGPFLVWVVFAAIGQKQQFCSFTAGAQHHDHDADKPQHEDAGERLRTSQSEQTQAT